MAVGNELSSSKEKQRTLSRPIEVSGAGLFTGVKVKMRFVPAEEDTGIRFQRTDLPEKPILPARVENVRGTPRCTIIGCDQVHIQTVEHVLAALKAYEIDNLLIEVSGCEIPSCDGSAIPFVEMIEQAGIEVQGAQKKVLRIQEPVFWSKGDVTLVALPAEDFRISYTLNYPNSDFLRAQFHTGIMSSDYFKQEIAPARTFSLYEEIVPLIERGSIKGGSLENAVIIKNDQVINPEGLRFKDEMVRHKVLDLVGDLSLVGVSFHAHIIAIRSGHFSNTSLAKELVASFRGLDIESKIEDIAHV